MSSIYVRSGFFVLFLIQSTNVLGAEYSSVRIQSGTSAGVVEKKVVQLLVERLHESGLSNVHHEVENGTIDVSSQELLIVYPCESSP